MKILILGGTRFIGPHVLKKLCTSGHNVMIFHRGKSNIELPENARELLGDKNELSSYQNAFKRFLPDVVLDMMLLFEQQAHQLVETMSGISERLIVISSCDVYKNYGLLIGKENGPATQVKLSEKAPLRDNYYPYRDLKSDKKDTLYNYDKIPVERIILAHPEISSIILRLPMVYGPGDYQYRFWEYIKRMIDRRPAIIIDELQARWRITRAYVENAAEAICSAIINRFAGSTIYNVGEPTAIDERTWLDRIGKIINWQGKIISVPREKLPDHLKTEYRWQYNLDIDTLKIRNELGFKEIVCSDCALKRTIDWQRQNSPKYSDLGEEYKKEDEFLAKHNM